MLKVLVAQDGGVDSVVVAESSGHAELDSVAVRGMHSPPTRTGS